MLKKKLFLTMAAILLLCVSVMTVYAVGQPAEAADKQAAGEIVDEQVQAQRVDVLDVLNVQDLKHQISIIIPYILNNLL